MRNLLFIAGIGLLAPYWLSSVGVFILPLLVVALLLSYWRPLRWIILLVMAFAYSSYQVQLQAQQQLRDCPHKLQVKALLQIEEVQPTSKNITRLVAVVRALSSESNRLSPETNSCQLRVNQRLRLTWRAAPNLVIGSTWQLALVLSEPWGYQNPGGFDYERWLLGENLAATGYVRDGMRVVEAPKIMGLQRVRANLTAEFARYAQAGVLQALVLGDVSKLDGHDWQRLRASGTVHLFIVSGLHIGLVATTSFFLASWLVRLLPWVVARIPAIQVAIWVALVVSAAYVLLTGANVPGVRAWLMLCLALAWIGRGRHLDMWLGFLWALVIVLLCLPRSGWQLGFYLSFGAVGVLMWFFRPRQRVPAAAEPHLKVAWFLGLSRWLVGQAKLLLQIQLALLLGLGPLTVALGLATPSLGLLVNLVAVPWVSLVVVPLALLGTLATLVSNVTGHLLLAGANTALLMFQKLLDAATVGWLLQPPGLAWWVHGLHGLIGLLCLLPMGWRIRLCLLLAYASVLLSGQPRGVSGEFRLMVMDVGQGSAILVSTKNHHLLFDSGPAFESGFTAAKALIVPTFGALAVRRLDGFVVSHEDADHAGGAKHIRELWQSGLNLQGGLPSAKAVELGFRPCQAGQSWIWDEVKFEILSPSVKLRREPSLTSNDASCVLRIVAKGGSTGPGHQALLLGDISQGIEMQLLPRLQSGVTIMTAPHHGSATSSSYALVRRLRPQLVVASAGRHSRYGHPHPDVVARYCGVGARLFVTGEVGAVTWWSGQPRTVHLARAQAMPWRDARSSAQLARCR